MLHPLRFLLPALAFAFSPAHTAGCLSHRYTSGGEDGYMRIHRFDPSYFDFEFEH